MRAWMLTTEMTPKLGINIAPSLRSRDYKDPPIVCMEIESEESSCSFRKDGSTESSRRESDI